MITNAGSWLYWFCPWVGDMSPSKVYLLRVGEDIRCLRGAEINQIHREINITTDSCNVRCATTVCKYYDLERFTRVKNVKNVNLAHNLSVCHECTLIIVTHQSEHKKELWLRLIRIIYYVWMSPYIYIYIYYLIEENICMYHNKKKKLKTQWMHSLFKLNLMTYIDKTKWIINKLTSISQITTTYCHDHNLII